MKLNFKLTGEKEEEYKNKNPKNEEYEKKLIN